MAIYRKGQASMDAQGYITGYDTNWREQLTLIRSGATIVFATSPASYAVISEVISDTQIRAISTGGVVVDRTDYVIFLHDSLTVDGLAQDVAETLRYYQGKESEFSHFIEFLETFDWKRLEDLTSTVVDKSNHVDQVAIEVESDRAESEVNKNASAQSAIESAQSAANSEISNQQSKSQADRAQTIADGIQSTIDSATESAIGKATEQADRAQTIANGIQTTIDSATESVLQEATKQAGIATNKAAEATNEANRATSEADRAKEIANSIDSENLLHKDKNLSDVKDIGAARDNLQVNRLIQNSELTIVASPDANKYLEVRTDSWGLRDVRGAKYIPLGIAQGGTGASDAAGAPFAQKSQNLADLSDKEAARRNLRIDMVEADADTDESLLRSPANDAWLFINKKNKNWGVHSVNGDYAGLNIESGGTGAKDKASARANLEVPGLKTGNFFTGQNSFAGGIYVRPELTSDTSYREICNDTYGRDQSGGVIRSRQFMADGVTLVSAAGMYAWKNTAWGHYPGVLEFNDAINGYGGYAPIDDIVNAGKMSLAPIAYGYCDGASLANGRGAVITRVSAGQYTIRLSGYAHYMPPGRTRRFYLQLTVDMSTEYMIRTQYTSSAGNENGVWRVITTRDDGNSLIVNDARWYFTVYCSWY